MSASVTVVVPTRNAGRTIDACLRSVRAQAADGVELVVVDNHSTDATAAIAARLADRVEIAGPERSAQRNRGARLGTGGVLLFVDADMVLEPGVVSQVVRALADPSVAAVVIPEHSFGAGMWARAKALEKQLVLGDPAVEGARGFRRDDFERVGGYDEALNAYEDWDVADRIVAAHGGTIGRTAARIWHDEGRLRLRGTFAKKRYYGQWTPQWRAGASPQRLRRRLSSRELRLLARSPLSAAALVTMKVVELAGFTAGARAAGRAR